MRIFFLSLISLLDAAQDREAAARGAEGGYCCLCEGNSGAADEQGPIAQITETKFAHAMFSPEDQAGSALRTCMHQGLPRTGAELGG